MPLLEELKASFSALKVVLKSQTHCCGGKCGLCLDVKIVKTILTVYYSVRIVFSSEELFYNPRACLQITPNFLFLSTSH